MTREDFLRIAETRINSREGYYGKPENNFNKIADLWSAYLKTKITAKDVALMMGLFKIARIQGGAYKLDSYVDAIGYLACGGEIASVEGGEEE